MSDMECTHCGLCCKDACTQVNLTIGDIYRISDFLNKPIDELIPEFIDINPFGDPDLIHYDLDIGLNNPCKFRKDGKCSIYEARPLNCRIFPYWILARAPPEQLTEILSEHGCRYDITLKKDYAKYSQILGDIILQESKWLELNRKVNVTRLKSFNEITETDFRAKEEAKVKLIKEWNQEKIDKDMIQSIITRNFNIIKENTDKIKEAEKILK